MTGNRENASMPKRSTTTPPDALQSERFRFRMPMTETHATVQPFGEDETAVIVFQLIKTSDLCADFVGTSPS